MKRLWWSLRVRLIGWLLPPELKLIRRASHDDARAAVSALAAYTQDSGHLTRAFKAGRRVRSFAERIADHLEDSRPRPAA